MQLWYNSILDNSRYAVDIRGTRVRIGRNPDNDVVLDSPFVAGEALILTRRGNEWELLALGMNGCNVGDREVRGGERTTVAGGVPIKLFPFTLTLDIPQQSQVSGAELRDAQDREASAFLHAVHLDLLSRMDLDGGDDNTRQKTDEYLLTLERHLEEIAHQHGIDDRPKAALVQYLAGQCLHGDLLGSLTTSAATAGVWQTPGHWSRLVSQVPEREEEIRATVRYFTKVLRLDEVRDLSRQGERIEKDFWPAWEKAVTSIHQEFKQYLALRYLKKEIKDMVFGYGPLEDLLRTPLVSEIMVVDREHIYIEKNGVVENSGRRFTSDAVTQAIIERIVARVGRRIDKSSPLVDARLSDGSRVNAVIPPLAVSGPCLTIRKFPARRLLIDDLVARGSLTRSLAEFLRAAVLARKNILIAGGTGTGKTTLLNCLSDFIPNKERIVTIEDTAELQLQKEHVVRLETKEANIEGTGAYTIRQLVKNALRMRPDRIVVGECRGPEALDMLQAMNTGHDGSLTTIHANTAEDTVLRLEVLVQMAADLPVASIHQQIASAIDLIVQLRRMHDGSRQVVQVTEVVGIDDERGGVRTKDIFMMEPCGDGMQLCATGHLPTFMDELIRAGLLQLETFYR
jgi:pilus assembly protein CpaF